MVGLFANLMRVTLNMSALAALILFCTPAFKKEIFGQLALLGLDGHYRASFDSLSNACDRITGFERTVPVRHICRMDSATGFENADFSGSGEADSAGCPYPARTVEPDRTTENF